MRHPSPLLSQTAGSHDGGFAIDRPELLAQAYHAWVDRIGRPEIKEDDVVLLVVNQFVQGGDEVSMPPPAEPALEHRELQPFPVAVHLFEDRAPALRITDVVRDDIKMFVHRTTAW